MSNYILAKNQKETGIITINSPANMNSMSAGMLQEIANQIKKFEENDAIKTIVIKGHDKFFVSGIDIKNILDDKTLYEMQEDFQRIENCSKIIISSVSGNVLGAGLELALASDFVLAADNAIFAFPETSLNFIPCFGGIKRLINAIGKSKAMEMILTNRAMKAEEAERSGIISRIIPLSELEKETLIVAEKVSKCSKECIQLIKESLANQSSSNKAEIDIEKRIARLRFLDTNFQKSLLNL